ncbi:hypothetical protein ACIRST_12430 [Kitasatospora sp. NPDC101447]|uniref:hypothetical protein n=1 Tax=Kitasatospora sp. NPDC101447 TaxID=3364102 RepID=UPI00380A75E9
MVLIDATAPVASAAHALGCRVALVQRPGSPVHELAGDETDYYSVDFETRPSADPAYFTDFVDTVLRPLNPVTVLSLTGAGALAAATANALLGTPGTPVDAVKALAAAGDPEVGDGERVLRAHTFTTDGAHRWVAAVEEGGSPTRPEQVLPERALPPEEYGPALAALTGLLDASGLPAGPALVRLALRDGGVRILTASHGTGTDDENDLIRRLTGFDLMSSSLRRPLAVPAPPSAAGPPTPAEPCAAGNAGEAGR